jgi:integrase
MARRGDGLYQRGGKGGTWYLDFMFQGQRHVTRLGRGISRTVARELAGVARAKILRGEAGIGPKRATAPMFAAWVEQWQSGTLPHLAEHTRHSYRYLFRQHVLPEFGPLRLDAITRDRVKAFLAAKRGAGLSKNTVRLIRSALSVALGDAVEAGLLPMNPCANLTRPGRKGPDTVGQSDRDKAVRPLSHEELGALLAFARPREWFYFMLLGDTGLRPSEGLALQWPDFDPVGRTLNVGRSLAHGRVKSTKTGQARRVTLTPRLAAALDARQTAVEAETLLAGREPVAWVMAEGLGERPANVKTWSHRLKRSLVRAGVARHRLYDLRHTYACHLLAGRHDDDPARDVPPAPIAYVAKQMGHVKITTTLQHYIRWIPGDDDGRWAVRLERARSIPNAVPDAVGAVAGAAL